MTTINFKPQFANKVKSGEKRMTIRKFRKRPFKVGDKVYLYTGLRTKKCRKLGEGVIISVRKVKIFIKGVIPKIIISDSNDEIEKYVRYESYNLYNNRGYFRSMGGSYCETLAKADGFNSRKDFFDFFEKTHGLPFTGQIIKWRLK